MVHLKALVMTVLISMVLNFAFFWFVGEQDIFFNRPLAIVCGSLIGLVSTLIVVTSILTTKMSQLTSILLYLQKIVTDHDLMPKPDLTQETELKALLSLIEKVQKNQHENHKES